MPPRSQRHRCRHQGALPLSGDKLDTYITVSRKVAEPSIPTMREVKALL